MRLRGTVDSTITQCANDMWSSWNTSNSALQQRVAETTTAHNNLQSHLARTNQEIYDQQKHISHLQKAIRDKEAPLMVFLYIIVILSLKSKIETKTIRVVNIADVLLFSRFRKPGLKQELIGLMWSFAEINHSTDWFMKLVKSMSQ